MVVRRRGRPTRFLAAVVFTDIAGSTEVAARLGDDGWKKLLERYQRLVRSALYRFGGREIDTAGDGVYATFESPARAILFGIDVAERAEALGIRVRSGVHMGEVELIGGKAGGIAVHIGARIAALAEPGEVLVSGTVRDLVTGSAVGFEDRGTTELKGVPGQWALYSATALEMPTALPDEARLPLRERIGTGLRSTRWRVALALVLVVVVAMSALAAFLLLQPRYLPGVEANAVGRISAAGNGIVSSVPVGSLPDAIAFGEGSLWVTDTTTGSVARIDPHDSRVIQTIEVEGSPNAVAVGHGSVWVSNGNARTVSRVSPATNRVIATVTVGNGPSGVAADERWVWVTNRIDGTLARIDPQNSAATFFHVGTTPAGVAIGAGSVWVSDFDTASVVRVDPASGATTARIYVGNGPTSVAASDDQVWVVNSRDGTLSRIDPRTNSVATTITVGAEPGVVAAAGSVWVTVASTSEIVRIDPSSNSIVRRIPVQSRPRGIAVAGDDTWFTARGAAGSHRGGILRIVAENANFMPSSLDPALSFTFGLNQILLTNDGLVGYKRAGGADGLTLVPDLAISMPALTDGGRTYTFQLRPGIVYSDGTTVRALDVRRSLERLAAITPGNVEYLFGSSLEGLKSCDNAPATCDLSSLVHVDEQANSVTFRLNAPDPDFLYRLAYPEFAVLPADTPREPATAPLPATGPYMAQPFDADGGIRLIRNPRFVEWSHEAQPDGYPDEIVWRIAAEGEDLVGSVAAGDDDVTTSSPNPFSPDRVAELSAQFADQLFAGPPSVTFFEFMNTTLPPFDQLKVRQAVNLATDRKRVVELYGGRPSGRETCQARPPGFPGYEPYCPYTVNPGPGGAWLAPNMAEAHHVIDGAGVAGTPVTVRAFGEFAAHVAVGSYFVELLDELGFDASLTTTSLEEANGPDFDAYTADWQMMGLFFLNNHPAPSSHIIGAFTCPDFSVEPGAYGNYAAFCDPEIDALALHAYELQATDPSAASHAWAEVDHLIVDQSPAVAIFNPAFLQFVSKRVGNVQLNPQLGILLDQLWVQ